MSEACRHPHATNGPRLCRCASDFFDDALRVPAPAAAYFARLIYFFCFSIRRRWAGQSGSHALYCYARRELPALRVDAMGPEMSLSQISAITHEARCSADVSVLILRILISMIQRAPLISAAMKDALRC